MFKQTLRNGFTLIELLIVVTILGVLASVAFVSYNSAQAKSRDSRRIADLGSIKGGLEMYKELRGQYPLTDAWIEGVDTATTGETIVESISKEGLLSTIPRDPMSTDSALTGYAYVRYDWNTLFLAAPILPTDKRYGLYASLEKKTDAQQLSVSGDYEKKVITYFNNKSIWSAEDSDMSRHFNYALVN